MQLQHQSSAIGTISNAARAQPLVDDDATANNRVPAVHRRRQYPRRQQKSRNGQRMPRVAYSMSAVVSRIKQPVISAFCGYQQAHSSPWGRQTRHCRRPNLASSKAISANGGRPAMSPRRTVNGKIHKPTVKLSHRYRNHSVITEKCIQAASRSKYHYCHADMLISGDNKHNMTASRSGSPSAEQRSTTKNGGKWLFTERSKHSSMFAGTQIGRRYVVWRNNR